MEIYFILSQDPILTANKLKELVTQGLIKKET